jgi:predicted nucleic acid-binding protein
VSPAVPPTVVVVDTDAFSHLFVRQNSTPQRHELRARLVGRIPVIATQTRAELLAWPRLRSWGSERSRRLAGIVDSVQTVPISDDVVAAYIELQVSCVQVGHALGQKLHAGDRWVAATALALNRPLVSLDGIYADVRGLALL